MKKRSIIISCISICLIFLGTYLLKTRINRGEDKEGVISLIEDRHGDHTAQGDMRIISLAPSITETIFSLGLGDRLVGVTDFCDFPDEARSREKVGGYYDTSYEKILMLEPDLIIMLPEHEKQKASLSRLGIEILVVDQRAIPEILDSIRIIGERCGKGEKAADIAGDIDARIRSIKEKTEGMKKPRVMICIGRTFGTGRLEDIYISGNKGFYNELIGLAGGVNAYDGNMIRYPSVTAEGIIGMNPEVIIEMVPDLCDRGLDKDSLVRDWGGLPGVDAVKNRRIFVCGEDYVAIPGPRFILILEKMAEVIHPEVQW